MDGQSYILPMGEGENTTLYQIEKAVILDGRCFFSIVNLTTYDFFFGEYLGDTTEDPEKNRELIYQEFLNGCKKITFVDGYMEDELYETWFEI